MNWNYLFVANKVSSNATSAWRLAPSENLVQHTDRIILLRHRPRPNFSWKVSVCYINVRKICIARQGHRDEFGSYLYSGQFSQHCEFFFSRCPAQRIEFGRRVFQQGGRPEYTIGLVFSSSTEKLCLPIKLNESALLKYHHLHIYICF